MSLKTRQLIATPSFFKQFIYRSARMRLRIDFPVDTVHSKSPCPAPIYLSIVHHCKLKSPPRQSQSDSTSWLRRHTPLFVAANTADYSPKAPDSSCKPQPWSSYLPKLPYHNAIRHPSDSRHPLLPNPLKIHPRSQAPLPAKLQADPTSSQSQHHHWTEVIPLPKCIYITLSSHHRHPARSTIYDRSSGTGPPRQAPTMVSVHHLPSTDEYLKPSHPSRSLGQIPLTRYPFQV